MASPALLATRATALLLAVAAARPGADQLLQTELYPLLFRFAKKRIQAHPTSVRISGTTVAVPVVPPADIESVAHDVTTETLQHLIAHAARFDPDAGDGLSWALLQVNPCFVAVARRTYQTRRGLRIVPTDDEVLQNAADQRQTEPDPAAAVEVRLALQQALDQLSTEERAVTLFLKQYQFSYAETAQLVFGDASLTGLVDQARRRADRKLRKVAQALRASVEDEPAG